MEEIDLKEIIMLFWDKKIKIILITLIFAVLGIIYTETRITPMYTSSTTLVLATSENRNKQSANEMISSNTITTSDIIINLNLVSTYSELVRSNNIIRQVIENLGIEMSEDSLRNSVKVTAEQNTELIRISVTNESPENAAIIANEISKVFIEKVSEIYNTNNLHVLDKAQINTSPSNINKIKNIAIFSVIGVLISIIYIGLTNILDNTIKSEAEIERIFKIPVLCSLPLYNFDNKKGGKKK